MTPTLAPSLQRTSGQPWALGFTTPLSSKALQAMNRPYAAPMSLKLSCLIVGQLQLSHSGSLGRQAASQPVVCWLAASLGRRAASQPASHWFEAARFQKKAPACFSAPRGRAKQICGTFCGYPRESRNEKEYPKKAGRYSPTLTLWHW